MGYERTEQPPQFLQVLAQVIKQQPEALALVSPQDQWTYQQLDHMANRLQFYLADAGVSAGTVVAVHTESRALAIAAIVAILREGAAYLPLDPVYPAERLQYMLANAACRFLVTDNDAFSPPQVNRIDLRQLDMLLPLPKLALAPLRDADDAYIIYTSGSTGRPKGVRMNHGTLNNLLHWQNSQYSPGVAPRTLQFSALSFDVSFQEIFSTFCQGGTLVLVPPAVKQDFRALLTYIDQQRVERLFLPYIALLQLLQWANRLDFYPEALRQWITAGEQLVISDEVKKAFRAMPQAQLINQYGPSESHVVTQCVLPAAVDAWPAIPSIGKPISAARLLILNEHLQSVPPGELGELWISGPVLGNGYINNSQETAKRFVTLAVGGESLLAYRTGDIASLDAQGDIHYKGRTDAQIKISGYRVELGEIEARLLDLGQLAEVAVAVREQGDDKLLVAFVVPGTGQGAKDLPRLRERLAEQLPHYMVPAQWFCLPALLKTASGKVDRKSMLEQHPPEAALVFAPASQQELAPEIPGVAPSMDATGTDDDLPQRVLALVRRELQLPHLQLTDNLAQMGMTSLGANRIAAALYDDLQLDVPTYQLFQHRHLQSFIQQLLQVPNSAHTLGPSSAQAGAPVAIIGMALRVPGANSLGTFWTNLSLGVESLEVFEPTQDGRVNTRGILSGDPLAFDEKFFDITPREARFLDPQQRLLLELSWQALENAGVVPDTFNGRIGVFCGTGNNSYYLQRVLQNPEELESYGAFNAMLANEKDYCATRIAYKLNLVGPAVSVHSACSTSLVAVCQAVEAIRNGQCDIAIAGGASVTFPQQQPHEHQEGSIYSADGHTRPFDAASSGTVFSDGAGLVVLKRLDYARADGDHVYAAIRGVGLNNDGADKGSFSAPSIEGQRRVIGSALRDAGVSARLLGYVEAHGTATPLGDPIEVAALSAAFGEHTSERGFCQLGSVKSNFGHLTAAAGVVGLIKTALTLERGAVPAVVNFRTPNPALKLEQSPFCIPASLTPWLQPAAQRWAGVSSFGIGGTNAHIVMQGEDSAGPADAQLDATPAWLPLCLSAKSASALERLQRDFSLYLQTHSHLAMPALAAYLLQHRSAFAFRAGFGFSPANSLAQRLESAEVEPSPFVAKNLVLAFPGQGSQVVGMGQQLYQQQPAFRQALDDCQALLQANHQLDLLALLFEAPASELNQTQHTQVVLFAVAYALVQTLRQLGLSPQAALGHSIGELAAACVAGVFDLAVGLRLVVTRGRLMQAQTAGAMVAVREAPEALSRFLDNTLVVAAQNTPASCTLAGSHAAVEQLCERLTAASISFKRLDTSHAFHSPDMEPAKAAFIQALADVPLQAPRLPFISCVTGDWITPEQATSIHYWASQLREPVRFSQGLERLGELPQLVVVECGPQRTLGGMLAQTLPDKADLRHVSLLPTPGQDDCFGFSQALGRLWQWHLPIDWPIEPSRRLGFNHLPSYPFDPHHHEITARNAPAEPADAAAPSYTPIYNEADTKALMKNALISQLESLFSDISGMNLSGVDATASFFELGMDSLLLTQSSLKLKKTFKVNVNFRQLLNELNHFDALAQYLIDQGAEGLPQITPPSQPQPTAAPTSPSSAIAQSSAVAQAQAFSPLGMPSLNLASLPAAPLDGSLVGLMQQQLALLQHQLLVLTGQAPASVQPQAVPAASTSAPGAEKGAAAAAKTEGSVKPFGAGTRINVKRSNELTAEQQANLERLSARYNQRFASSKAFAQANRAQLADPRVVSGFRTTLKELIYPLVVKRSEGPYLWDMDDFKLVDITCGFGSNFFGNGAPFIKAAVAQQLETGYEIGPQHPLVAEAAQLFCEITGNDRVAFCNTGSEAVLGAVRLARTVTAKEKIVIFENDYHGINDEVIVTRGSSGFAMAAAAGIPEAAVENVIVLDYGDEKSLDYIAQHADDIACLLIEPVQSRHPDIQPREFLQKARQLCTDKQIAFIFDEVITGFRIHPRGAQGYYGITADICSYGKIVGGGMPIGVISGKREFMDALDGGHWQFGDASSPEVGVTYFAGTFVRHPLALAAAVAVLRKIQAEPHWQSWLNSRADAMVGEINAYAKAQGAPLKIANCGSMCKIKIPQEIPYEELIYVMLREKGLHVWDARPTFITTAHSDDDIAFIVQTFKDAIDEMLAMGFFPHADAVSSSSAPSAASPSSTSSAASASASPSQDYAATHFSPPVPGAKLGRDETGSAVWYVPSPSDPSSFVKWQG
jgi:amino acid adenylation domain-containing protein